MNFTSMRICMAIEANSSDSKKNVYKFKWLQPTGSRFYYEIPFEKQLQIDHSELFHLKKVKNILASMKTRGSFRTCTIALEDNLKEIYFDSDGDVVYQSEYLQQTLLPVYEKIETAEQFPSFAELLQKFNDTNLPKVEKKNLKKIKDDFVLRNFDGNNVPMNSWLKTFESECLRCEVVADEDKILILRLFLDGIAKEWFESKIITLGLDNSFEVWKINFLDSFCETGWHNHRQAYSFRYIGGSIVDYAFRKENLLLNIKNDFPIDILIDLIVTNLPIYIQDNINRADVTTMEKLVGELRKLESLVIKKKNKLETKPNFYQKSTIIPEEQKTTCQYCDRKGFPGRFHLEAICRLKQKDKKVTKENKLNDVKYTNNIAIQETLNETVTEQKN
ncbi:uncharacterized protein [Diabrotica undecimpunctata]|uniref:uncharacterized protein n=1 Tax=Diabrotica undecimpunctata TaxID=50387 RepID=UPI003B637179